MKESHDQLLSEINHKMHISKAKKRPKEKAKIISFHSIPSQLNRIVDNPHLFAGLERRQTDVRAPVTPESIAQSTAAARSRLPLHGEVDLVVQVFGLQLEDVQVRVGFVRSRLVFGFEFFG